MAANAVVERLEQLNSTNPPNVTSADLEEVIALASKRPSSSAPKKSGAKKATKKK